MIVGGNRKKETTLKLDTSLCLVIGATICITGNDVQTTAKNHSIYQACCRLLDGDLSFREIIECPAL